MTLMGTWITGYWKSNKLAPGENYDFFEVPTVADGTSIEGDYKVATYLSTL